MTKADKIQQKIISFHQDDLNDWVAVLACGHQRHVRHNPPWTNHPWVMTAEGRQQFLGVEIECKPCLENISALNAPVLNPPVEK